MESAGILRLVPSTQIQLRFRVWGPRLDPELLTSQIGVEPSRSFKAGEVTAAAANVVAGWEWRTSDGSDDRPMIDRLLTELGAHADILRSCREEGAEISLTAVGQVRGGLIETAADADRRGWYTDSNKPFEPILDVDRVGVSLSVEAIQFLAAIGASYQTHIDVEFEAFGG